MARKVTLEEYLHAQDVALEWERKGLGTIKEYQQAIRTIARYEAQTEV